MRIKVGKVVDLNKDVNLADLSPLDRIIASATNAYMQTNFYKRRFAETQEKIDEQTRKIKEVLANNILSICYKYLRDNALLSEKDDICRGVLIKVPYRFVKYLPEVIELHEFLQYKITIIPTHKLLKTAPHLVYIENRES